MLWRAPLAGARDEPLSDVERRMALAPFVMARRAVAGAPRRVVLRMSPPRRFCVARVTLVIGGMAGPSSGSE